MSCVIVTTAVDMNQKRTRKAKKRTRKTTRNNTPAAFTPPPHSTLSFLQNAASTQFHSLYHPFTPRISAYPSVTTSPYAATEQGTPTARKSVAVR